MAPKDLLVCVDRTRAGLGRLRLACTLAQRWGAHLCAVHPLLPPMRAPSLPHMLDYGPAAVPGMIVGGHPNFAEIGRPAGQDEIARSLFEEQVRAHGIAGEWHFVDDGDGEELIEFVKSADLAILGQLGREGRGDGAARFRPEEVMLAAGRPILVVPYAGTFETVGRRVLVAWDGTREACRAINDALPLIAEAEAVILFHVAAQPAALDLMRPALDRALRHLRHHGINARAEETPKGDIAVSDVLLSRAADLVADLIVAGGYHHSRWREAVLGGVTRELLAHLTLPVLMSH